MRLLFLSIFLIVNLLGAKDCKAQTGTFIWTNGAPTTNPGASGARFAVDRATFRWYEWVSGTSWVQSGDRIQRISGCSAPAYTPTIHNAYFVVNGCTEPEFYYWNGTAWKLLNGGGGATYTAGSGIAISGGNVISADTSILATQYDISQLGVSFPLLAANSTTPQYGFSSSTDNGLRNNNDTLYLEGRFLDIKTLDALFPKPLRILSGSAIGESEGEGSSVIIRAGSGADFGGNIQINAGGAIVDKAGSFLMAGGSSSSGAGGDFIAAGGNSGGSNGGSANIQGGEGLNGGQFLLLGGNGTDGDGGQVIITSGGGTNNGGSVYLGSGGGGTDGIITIQTGAEGVSQPVIVNSAGVEYKGFTTTERNALTGLTEGRLIWNTTTKSFNSYDGTSWHEIPKIIKASATLNFPSTGAHSGSDLTITATGAAVGDAVTVAPGVAAIVANSCYTAWVSAANTVTVRYNHYGSGSSDPASAVFNVIVTKY
jgi:hypothetical protein